MKTLFSRILIAQVVAVVLALAVVTLITRASLNKGFTNFLHRQETAVLQNIAPVLTEFYERQGGWDLIRENPNNWQRVWRIGRAGSPGSAPGGPRQGRVRPRPGEPPGQIEPPGSGLDPELRWMAQSGRGMLRDRLFLLDENRVPIAGPGAESTEGLELQVIVVDGKTVGWIGFSPMGNALPPEARRFLENQLKIMFLAFGAALAVAAVLAWVLARNVSRPVRQIGRTVRRLSDGDYNTRAAEASPAEIAALARHVNRLAESLERNRTARQRWMADIAHELRTPVAVMKGEIEAIADGVREADAKTAASLTEEVDHLAGMVDDLQALALADAGALGLRKEPLELADLVVQTVDSFRNRLAERKIRLDIERLDPVQLSGDVQRIRQLMHNLMENSCRYSQSGGAVRINLAEEQGAVLVIEDSGPGVDDDQLERLFDRFYRVEGSRSRATGGTGLGLSICRNIAEAHGGTIDAAHGSLGGLSVRVWLPAGD